MSAGLLLGGRYELQVQLGAGGFGSVWRARDTILLRDIAVKLIQFESDGDTAARDMATQRFQREAQAVAGLNHPNVVAAYDFGVQDDTAYLVMELVLGTSLAQQVQRRRAQGLGPMEVATVVRIAIEICAGLDVAHRAGLVHRDLKPGNIMIADPGGQVKIVDFGIARVADRSKLTRTGSYMGTLPYIAPEQMSTAPMDGRADLYSLGCLLHELLTGRSPYTAESPVQWLAAHQYGTPAPLSAHLPGAPAVLERLLLDMLAKDPADRPATAEAARERFVAIRSGPVEARPVPGPTVVDPPPTQAGPGPISGQQISAPPVSAPPISAPPVSGQQVYGPPVSAPPISGQQISAPPVSAPPISGRPGSGQQVSGMPATGTPHPAQQPMYGALAPVDVPAPQWSGTPVGPPPGATVPSSAPPNYGQPSSGPPFAAPAYPPAPMPTPQMVGPLTPRLPQTATQFGAPGGPRGPGGPPGARPPGYGGNRPPARAARSSRRTVVILVIAIVVVLAGAGVAIGPLGLFSAKAAPNAPSTPGASGSQPAVAGRPECQLKIAFLGTKNSPYGARDDAEARGMQLALSQYNKAHVACPVTPATFDTNPANLANPAPSVTQHAAAQLIADTHVIGVIGPAVSGDVSDVLPLLKQGGVTTITPSANNDGLTTIAVGGGIFHRAIGGRIVLDNTVAAYVAAQAGAKVYLVDDGSNYGVAMTAAVKAAAGGLVAGSARVAADGVQTDFGTTVTKITNAKATVVVYGGYAENAGRILARLRAAGSTAQFIAGDVTDQPDFAKRAGSAAIAKTATFFCLCAVPVLSDRGFSADFAAANGGQQPNLYADIAFDATNMMLNGIGGGATTRAALQTYISSTNYPARVHTYHFAADGSLDPADIVAFKITDDGAGHWTGDAVTPKL